MHTLKHVATRTRRTPDWGQCCHRWRRWERSPRGQRCSLQLSGKARGRHGCWSGTWMFMWNDYVKKHPSST